MENPLEGEETQKEGRPKRNITKQKKEVTHKNGTTKRKKKKTKGKQRKKFTCVVCKKQCYDQSSWVSHMEIHSTEYPYGCDICTYRCKVKKYLSRHVRKVHSAPTGNPCPMCGKCFHFPGNLRNHIRVHTGEKPNKCNVCGKAFSSKYCLSIHKLIHTGEKPYKCSFCDYACRDSSTIRKHQERHMGTHRSYECTICKKVLKERHSLKRHIDEVHFGLENRNFPCDRCEKVFKARGALTIHIKAVHEKTYRTKCEVCGRVVSAGNIKIHLRTHVNVRPYKCGFKHCTRSFREKGDLKKHSLIHYPSKQFRCGICGRKFARKERLNAHTAQHLPDSHSVQCDYCMKTYANKMALGGHIKRKHGKNSEQYICDDCGIVVYSKRNITAHLQYGHGSVEETKCKICLLICEDNSKLRTHYLSKHNVKYVLLGQEDDLVQIKEEPLDQQDDSVMDFTYEVDIEKHELEDILNLDTVKQEDTSETEEYIEQPQESPEEPKPEDIPEQPKPQKNIKQDNPDSDSETDYSRYSKKVLSEDIHRRIVQGNEEDVFDQFFVEHMVDQSREEAKIPPPIEDERKKRKVEKRLEKLLIKARKKNAWKFLAKLRESYNERILVASQPKQNKQAPRPIIKYYKKPSETASDSINEEINIEKMDDAADEENTSYNNNVINNGEDIPENNVMPDEGIKTCKSNNEEHRDTEEIIDNNSSINKDLLKSNNEILELNEEKLKEGEANNINDEQKNYSNNEELETIDGTVDNNCGKNEEFDNNEKIIEITPSNNTESECTEEAVKNNNINKENLQNDVDMESNIEIVINKEPTESNNVTNKRSEKPTNNEETKNNEETTENAHNNEELDEEELDNIGEESDDSRDSDYKGDTGKKVNLNAKLKFNMHQCYICFQLYKTKTELKRHSETHFDLCNEKMLKKCPFCGYVTNLDIKRHIKLVHKIKITIPYAQIKEKHNNTGSKYVYEIQKDCDLEVIPSISNLNKMASVKIDKQNRENKNLFLGKTKLVKKGKEWVVEKQALDINSDYLLPEFTKEEYKTLKDIGDNYVDRLKSLNILAKKRGVKMLYPCKECDKICLNLAALRLHSRKHEDNPKPFKPKVWKNTLYKTRKNIEKEVNKYNAETRNKNKSIFKTRRLELIKDPKRIEEAKKSNKKDDSNNVENRFATPKPVKNNHKCDKKLIEFYHKNIKGKNIEFWQFLKIFNKMTRENVKDFKDLEERTDFGIHKDHLVDEDGRLYTKEMENTPKNKRTKDNTNINPPSKVPKVNTTDATRPINAEVSQPSKVIPTTNKTRPKSGKANKKFTRVVMISKKEYLRRKEIKEQMRKRIEESRSSLNKEDTCS